MIYHACLLSRSLAAARTHVALAAARAAAQMRKCAAAYAGALARARLRAKP